MGQVLAQQGGPSREVYQTPKKKKKDDKSALQDILNVAQQGLGRGKMQAILKLLRR